MAYLLKFGGTTIGTQLLYDLPDAPRLMRPIEDGGVDQEFARLTEVSPSQIWRPQFVVYHEAATPFAFSRWVVETHRLLRTAGRADVTCWDDGSLMLTYPNCAYVSFNRPRPRDTAEAFFSADLTFEFVTDEEPS